LPQTGMRTPEPANRCVGIVRTRSEFLAPAAKGAEKHHKQMMNKKAQMFCHLMDVHRPQNRGKDTGPPRRRTDPHRWLVVRDGRVRQVPKFVHLLSPDPDRQAQAVDVTRRHRGFKNSSGGFVFFAVRTGTSSTCGDPFFLKPLLSDFGSESSETSSEFDSETVDCTCRTVSYRVVRFKS
jgi:hypothetical protein